MEPHSHDFRVVLHLRAARAGRDLFGLDMVEIEKLLKSTIDRLPEVVNDLEGYPNGTTEQLCEYFAHSIELRDREVELVAISVSETPGRVTKLFLTGQGS